MSESASLRGFRTSVHSTPKRRLRSAGGAGAANNASVPGYAQTTISFSQHKVNENTGKILTLKAGASRSRPTTKSSLKASPRSSTANNHLKKAGNSLTGLFQNDGSNQGSPNSKSSVTSFKHRSSYPSPESNFDNPYFDKGYNHNDTNGAYDQLTLKKGTKSGSYRSPSLARKVEAEKLGGSIFMRDADDDNQGELKKLIYDTEKLIIEHGNPLAELAPVFTKAELLGILNGRTLIPLEEWESLVEYHSTVIDKYDKKMAKDSELVVKVLELNNKAALETEKYKKQLRTIEQEVEILRSTLNLVYKDNLKYEQVMGPVSVKSINNSVTTPLSGHIDDLQGKSFDHGASNLSSPNKVNERTSGFVLNGNNSAIDEKINNSYEFDDLDEINSDISAILPPISGEKITSSALTRAQNYLSGSSSLWPGPLGSAFPPSDQSSSNVYEDIYKVLSQPE